MGLRAGELIIRLLSIITAFHFGRNNITATVAAVTVVEVVVVVWVSIGTSTPPPLHNPLPFTLPPLYVSIL